MKLLPSSVSAICLGFRLALEVARLELAALAFELLLVGLVGAQRLALRQQEIAGKAVLDLDGIAHLAEAGNAFEKNDFHGLVPFICSRWRHATAKPQLSMEQVRKPKRRRVAAAVAVLPVAAVRGCPAPNPGFG